MHFFQAHYFSILYFLNKFKDKLKATYMAWCPYNDNVTQKYLTEMRRLARDKIPFLSTMQLRAITLDWWPDGGNFIPLNIHENDRPTCDETSYPPTNLLIILNNYLMGPPFLKDKCFIAFLGDPWEKHLEGSYIGFYLLPKINPSGPSSPSSHRMRDNLLLGKYTLKSQEVRKWGEIVMESGKYGREQYDGYSREFLV
jgi:hypothetical protein